jgi:hypothetical protein
MPAVADTLADTDGATTAWRVWARRAGAGSAQGRWSPAWCLFYSSTRGGRCDVTLPISELYHPYHFGNCLRCLRRVEARYRERRTSECPRGARRAAAWLSRIVTDRDPIREQEASLCERSRVPCASRGDLAGDGDRSFDARSTAAAGRRRRTIGSLPRPGLGGWPRWVTGALGSRVSPQDLRSEEVCFVKRCSRLGTMAGLDAVARNEKRPLQVGEWTSNGPPECCRGMGTCVGSGFSLRGADLRGFSRSSLPRRPCRGGNSKKGRLSGGDQDERGYGFPERGGGFMKGATCQDGGRVCDAGRRSPTAPDSSPRMVCLNSAPISAGALPECARQPAAGISSVTFQGEVRAMGGRGACSTRARSRRRSLALRRFRLECEHRALAARRP